MRMPADELEKRLTEFQVIESADGQSRRRNRPSNHPPARAAPQRSLHRLSLADTAQELFWERIQLIASHHGVSGFGRRKIRHSGNAADSASSSPKASCNCRKNGNGSGGNGTRFSLKTRRLSPRLLKSIWQVSWTPGKNKPRVSLKKARTIQHHCYRRLLRNFLRLYRRPDLPDYTPPLVAG